MKSRKAHMIQSTYSVNINLKKDWEQLTREYLKDEGFKVDDKYEAIDYFKALRKIIPCKPREIFHSKEFDCPQEILGDLKLIEKVIKKGDSLKPFMSRRFKDIKYNDLLLNDWNIHHFHLSSELEIKNGKYTGLMKRSDWLLMTFINDDAAYFINVYPHGEKYLWTRKSMLEIISRNWPELIEKFKLKEIKELGKPISEKEYAELRRCKALVLTQLDEGSVFAPIGGGYASSGASIMAVMQYDYWSEYLNNAQEIFEEKKYSVLKYLADYSDFSSGKAFDIQTTKITGDKIILLEKKRMIFIEIDFNVGKIGFKNTEYFKKRSTLPTRIESKLIS